MPICPVKTGSTLWSLSKTRSLVHRENADCGPWLLICALTNVAGDVQSC